MMFGNVITELNVRGLSFFTQTCMRCKMRDCIVKVVFVVLGISNANISIVVQDNHRINRSNKPKHSHVKLSLLPSQFIANVSLNDVVKFIIISRHFFQHFIETRTVWSNHFNTFTLIDICKIDSVRMQDSKVSETVSTNSDVPGFLRTQG